MSLLGLSISNCGFLLDQDCLGEKDNWFVDQILKRSGTMAETRKCIAEFNHQYEIVKRTKRCITDKQRSEPPVAIVCAGEGLPVAKGGVSTRSINKDSVNATIEDAENSVNATSDDVEKKLIHTISLWRRQH